MQGADDPVPAPVDPEGQAVGEPHPDHAHDAHDHVVLHEHAEDVLAPDHASVEESQPWGHEQDECRTGQYPGGVTGVDVRHCALLSSIELARACDNSMAKRAQP